MRIFFHKIVLFILFGLFLESAHSQSGFYLYAGPSAGFTGDKIYSDAGGNYGYVIGADVRTNSDPMHFLLTIERGANDQVPNSKFSFIGGDDFIYYKFKVGLGFDIKKLGRSSGLRTKFQGNFMSISSYGADVLSNVPAFKQNGYVDLNDGIIGLSTMISYYKKNLNIGLEYEQGLFNLIKTKSDTKMNFINIVVGYRLF